MGQSRWSVQASRVLGGLVCPGKRTEMEDLSGSSVSEIFDAK